MLDGHQTGSDDDDVQLTQPASPFATVVVEDVEDFAHIVIFIKVVLVELKNMEQASAIYLAAPS